MGLTAPSTDKAVPLTLHREGCCRSILEYENNELGRAVYCGHPCTTKQVEGRTVTTSWCEVHHRIYIQAPHRQQQRSTFIKRRPHQDYASHRNAKLRRAKREPTYSITIAPERQLEAQTELAKGHGILRTARKLKMGVTTLMKIKTNMGLESSPVGAPHKTAEKAEA